MPINPSIAMGVKPIEFQDPLVAYGRVAQLQQAQQQNELAKMQMAEYERTRQEEEGVRNYLRGADITKPETQSGLLGYGKTGLSTLKSVQESQASQLKAKIDALKYHNDLATQSAQILGSVTDQPSWDAARTKLASLGGDANALPLAYDPNFVKSEMTSALSVKDQIERSTPKQLLKDVGGQVIAIQDNPNLPGYGQPIKGVAPIVKTATPGELLSNQIARGQLDVSRGQLGVAQQRLGVEQAREARQTVNPEGIAPKDMQKREAVYPEATAAVKGFESKSDSFVNDLKALRDHPGLSQITGLVAGRVPALTSEGRAAQALYDKVVAKGGFQALQDLRSASKTGGALGNVSNAEGKQLTASFAAIDRKQDAPDVKAAIDQAIADIEGSKTRMREAYDTTYSYKQGAASAKPAAPVTGKGAKFLGFE